MSKDPGIHPEFKIDGTAYDEVTIPVLAADYLDSGSEFKEKVGSFLQAWCSPAPYIVVRTSGSTGDPKEIQLKKSHMIHSAKATGSYLNIPEKSRALLCLSADTIAGKMMLVRAMVLGWDLDIVAPSSTPLLDSDKMYDFSAMVPLQLRKSMDSIPRIKTLIVGGAAFPDDLRAAVSKLKTRVYESFGMTETATHIALKKVNYRLEDPQSEEDAFETLPGITVSTDDRGCLVIHAPGIIDEDIVTNDLVEILTPKKFNWLGRWDHIINSGGIKLIPEQIEKKLGKHLTSRFIIGSLPDRELGEKLILIAEGVGDAGIVAKRIKELKTLDRYERPRQIFFMKRFPETRSGKPDRIRILSQLKEQISFESD